MKKSARSAKPLSMSNLSGSVLSYIARNPDTSFQQVSDALVCEMSQENEKTTRRRVHDVLNIFCAAGLVTRNAKSLRYCPQALEPGSCSAAPRCEEKQRQIAAKIGLLLAYRTLIERNRSRARPQATLQLPAIIIGFENRKGTSAGGIDGRTLVIRSETKPKFFSPMDILRMIPTSALVADEFFAKNPEMQRFRMQIVTEEKPAEKAVYN